MFRLGNKSKGKKMNTLLTKGLIIEYDYTQTGLQIKKSLQYRLSMYISR